MRETRPDPGLPIPETAADDFCLSCAGTGYLSEDGVRQVCPDCRGAPKPAAPWTPNLGDRVRVKRCGHVGMTGRVGMTGQVATIVQDGSPDCEVRINGYGETAWVRASDLEPSQPLSPENAEAAAHCARLRRECQRDAALAAAREADERAQAEAIAAHDLTERSAAQFQAQADPDSEAALALHAHVERLRREAAAALADADALERIADVLAEYGGDGALLLRRAAKAAEGAA